MRKTGKIFGLLFAIVMMISLFSITVSASPTVISTGNYTEYSYTLYSDGELIITSKDTYRIDLSNIKSDIRSKVKTVTLDMSSWDTGRYTSFGLVVIDGSSCEATKLNLITDGVSCTCFSKLTLKNFPKISGDSIFVPQHISVPNLELDNMAGIVSLDFAKEIKTNYMSVLNCENLTDGTIDIPTLQSIGIVNASKLKTIDLTGTQVFSIGFPDCSALTDVKLPSTVSNLYYDGLGSFKGCKSLKSLKLGIGAGYINSKTFAESGLESLKLPAGSTFIGDSSFKDCMSLKSVYIPATMNTIMPNAFSGCTVLADVFFAGTEEQWNDLYGGSDLSNATIHFDCEYEPEWYNNGYAWKYYDKKGAPVDGWYEIDNNWYHFEPFSSYMQKEWQEIDGSWYYFGGNGIMRTDWQKVGGSWYYFGPNGSMRKGWQQISGSWYYFGDSGSMKTGWQYISGSWYFFGASGIMRTGWQTVDGKTYFFKSTGAMAYNEYCEGYWLNSDGTWTYKYKAKWTKDSKGWWFGDDSGWYAKNGSYTIDGKVYNFDASGYCLNP